MPSKIANQYVMISGEGGSDLGGPNVLTPPASIHQPASIATMTIEIFSTKVKEKGKAHNYPFLVCSNVNNTTKVLQISPIPPFLLYDGFEKDLDSAEVLERILSMDRDGGGQYMNLHLQQFLLYCLSSQNTNNPKPYVNIYIMMQTPSDDAKKWGKNQFARLFPSLQESPAHPTPPAPNIVELLETSLPTQAGILASRRIYGERKQADDTPAASDRLSIATPKLKALLKMCGKTARVIFDSLPTRFQKCGKIDLL